MNIKSKNATEVKSVSIYNALGQLLQVITGRGESIDVSQLPAGNYFVRVLSDKGIAASKFTK